MLTLQVKESSIHSIIGPNGAGKTTLFNCITGFYTPEEGEILLDGHDITGYSPDRVTKKGIARTYQNIRLFKNMTSVENIMVGMHPHLRLRITGQHLPGSRNKQGRKGFRGRVQVGCLFMLVLKVKEISCRRISPMETNGGLKLLAHLPASQHILLLDEPSAGMNPAENAEMVDFIRHLRDDLGITIVLIEHHMRVVMTISEMITVLDFGEKIAEGTSC